MSTRVAIPKTLNLNDSDNIEKFALTCEVIAFFVYLAALRTN
jgi:hypothetical protein